ncbi:hypothetical protein BDZ89DRAFT_565253 [Hymenopellis radicata]|nr:hypothetical protein BDZ89DRAFT_565253 [Hymenopellis radicata]
MGWHADNTNNLLDFLSLTRCVEQLRVDDICMTADFFVGLTVLEKSLQSGPTRLPFLRILDVVECTCHASLEADIAPIFDMLESRMIDLEETETKAIHVSQSGVGPDIPSDAFNQIRSLHPPGLTLRHRRSCLQTIRVPRWLYINKVQRWRDICAIFEVECGANVDDNDEYDDADDGGA